MSNRITKKDKKMFWAGLSVGIIGGVIGNLWVSSIFYWMENNYNIISTIWVVVFTIILLGILLIINKIIKSLK